MGRTTRIVVALLSLVIGLGALVAAPAEADHPRHAHSPSPAPTTGRARRPRPTHAGRDRARHLRGQPEPAPAADLVGPLRRLLRLRARLRQPGHRTDRELRRAAEDVRRPGARRHRCREGLDGRALAGRDDAALLHQVPRGSEQGRRPRRAGAVQPRHLQPAAADARASATCARRACSRRPARPSCGASTPATRPPARSATPTSSRATTRWCCPYTSGFLAGPNTTNVRLQAKCRLDLADHLLIPTDGPAIRLALNALGRTGPASPTYAPRACPETRSD